MQGMTKRERQVTDLQQIRQILEDGKVLHLGLCVNDEPYVVPMNYGYVMEDGKLTLKEELICQPGSGPRHLSFDGENAFYLVGELDGWMSRWDYEEGKWQCVQTLSSLPEGYAGPTNTAAAVRQDEGHVYLSNRGHDSIAVFKKLKNGWLEKPFFIRTPGTFPRDFLLMNGGFLLAQQKSGTVSYMNENGVPLAQVKIPGAVSLLVIDEK